MEKSLNIINIHVRLICQIIIDDIKPFSARVKNFSSGGGQCVDKCTRGEDG
jgi:hypothetical protein